MIPFILIAAGSYLIGKSSAVKFAWGDIVEAPPVNVGDIVVFRFLKDVWVEQFDDNQEVVSEDLFQEGEMVDGLLNDLDFGYYVITLSDGNKASINQMDVEVVSVNDEVLMAKGGETKWIQKAIKNKGALRKTAEKEGLIKGDEKLSKADLKKLEKKGGKTAKRAYLAETLKKINK